MKVVGFDFIDFGASEGSSMDFARNRLGGIRGIGLDIDPDKVARMRDSGHPCLEADITRLDLPQHSVRFVVMSHILEHLPDLATVEKVVAAGLRLVTDFVYIVGPYFDADDYLVTVDHWTGHPCHLRITDLQRMLRKMGVDDVATFQVHDEITDSSHPAVHPLDSPPDQHAYDASRHPVKPTLAFDRPTYREMVCVIPVRPLEGMDALLQARPKATLHAPRERQGAAAMSTRRAPRSHRLPLGPCPPPRTRVD